MAKKNTSGADYTQRLETLTGKKWKEMLDVQRPYRWNIRRLDLGETLEVGSGIGRLLQHLPKGSIGVDHNEHSVQKARALGTESYTTKEFFANKKLTAKKFDSMLMAHLLEHLTPAETNSILDEYLPFVRKKGKVVVICPQEKGYTTDETHVTFLTPEAIADILRDKGMTVEKAYSFPFHRRVGKIFIYNETVVVGIV